MVTINRSLPAPGATSAPASDRTVETSQAWKDAAKAELWNVPSIAEFRKQYGSHAERFHAFAQADAVMAVYQQAVNTGSAPEIVPRTGDSSMQQLPLSTNWRDLAKSRLWSIPSLAELEARHGRHAERFHALDQIDAVVAAYQEAVDAGLASAPPVVKNDR